MVKQVIKVNEHFFSPSILMPCFYEMKQLAEKRESCINFFVEMEKIMEI